jgi:uncharacterized protein (DUF58 family)
MRPLRPALGASSGSPTPRVRPYWLPRTIRPTREGVWFVAGTLAVGLAANNTGNNLLYLILAMLLSFLIISGILSEQALRRVRLHRALPRRLFAGVPAGFLVWLENGKTRMASYALHLEEADPSGGPAARHFVPRLDPGGRQPWQYALTFPRRGRHQLPGLILWTGFPFGLFQKLGRPVQRQAVLVFPAVRALAPAEVPAALEAGARARQRRGPGSTLHDIRPYRPGDDPRRIHWRTSARTGDLVLKVTAEEDRPRVRLLVEDPAAGWSAEQVEAALSRAASLAAWAIRAGMAVEVVTAEGGTGFGEDDAHLDRMLTRLALYRVPPAPRPLPAAATASPCVIRVPLDHGRGRGVGRC